MTFFINKIIPTIDAYKVMKCQNEIDYSDFALIITNVYHIRNISIDT